MKYYIGLLIGLVFTSCVFNETEDNQISPENNKESKAIDVIPEEVKNETEIDTIVMKPADMAEVDLDMDISVLTLPELRFLRNSFFAKHGYCFMQADIRAYFGQTDWYEDKLMDRFWAEEGDKAVAPITLTPAEEKFVAKLKAKEEELKLNNFKTKKGRTVINEKNIVNLFQLEEVHPELMSKLKDNGFAIVLNNNIQHFHVYEKNDYQQFPNFVTTDMYMQLFHMYFGYVLRTVEEDQFVQLTSEICLEMIADLEKIKGTTTNLEIDQLIDYDITYYTVAYTLLTDAAMSVPRGYDKMYEAELNNISNGTDSTSEFLEYTQINFPYSLFKPRGHYTRTDKLQKYFKAMMWLQTAPFCLDNKKHLKRAILSSSVLANNQSIMTKYKALMEPISFIIGQPDNVSFLQLADVYKKGNYGLETLLTSISSLNNFKHKVQVIAKSQNKIKPKEQLSCADKINFIPQRYLADNEVLQELVDVESQVTKRGYPKGLDVMAAFGSQSAQEILLNELQEGNKWLEYPEKLFGLQSKLKNTNWNATLYNKWISSLLELQKPDKTYPYFMQSEQWQKKDLNASLSSWAELKHDAILYAEQPMGAECGGAGPPDPYVVGYVEPNIRYWDAVIELIDMTQEVLKNNDLLTSDIAKTTTSMRENAQFLLSASEKELAGKVLSEEEYRQIELIGSTYEWLTLDLVKQKDQYIDGWKDVKGADKSVAVVADIYTAGAQNNPDRGVLHVATGNVNDIYVIVEINGYLYLTKGAVFDYHEFHLPSGNRLNDDEWQQMLDNNQAPKRPDWIDEIVVPIESPKANEKVFYSSGC